MYDGKYEQGEEDFAEAEAKRLDKASTDRQGAELRGGWVPSPAALPRVRDGLPQDNPGPPPLSSMH